MKLSAKVGAVVHKAKWALWMATGFRAKYVRRSEMSLVFADGSKSVVFRSEEGIWGWEDPGWLGWACKAFAVARHAFWARVPGGNAFGLRVSPWLFLCLSTSRLPFLACLPTPRTRWKAQKRLGDPVAGSCPGW